MSPALRTALDSVDKVWLVSPPTQNVQARLKLRNPIFTALQLTYRSLTLLPQLPFPRCHVPWQIADGLTQKITQIFDGPITVSSPLVQLRVSLEDTLVLPAGSTPRRIYREPFTAPGALASFDPLPAGAFDAVTAAAGGTAPIVQAKFVSFGFDPYASPLDGPDAARKAVACLRFSSAGGRDFVLENLPRPVTFSLPSAELAGSASGGEQRSTQGECVMWDALRGRFSAAGCAAAPNPIPPGIRALWRSDFAASAANVSTAWRLANTTAEGGRLLEGCSETILDCSVPLQALYAVYPNPTLPLKWAGAKCSQPWGALRVFTGAACPLWKPDNAADCFWCAR